MYHRAGVVLSNIRHKIVIMQCEVIDLTQKDGGSSKGLFDSATGCPVPELLDAAMLSWFRSACRRCHSL